MSRNISVSPKLIRSGELLWWHTSIQGLNPLQVTGYLFRQMPGAVPPNWLHSLLSDPYLLIFFFFILVQLKQYD